MPRKSRLRTMATGRWLRWAALRLLCGAVPSLARAWTFPVRSVRALDVADRVLEEALEDLRFAPDVDPAIDDLLQRARASDAGDTSTYAQRWSPVSSWLVTIPDCVISGRTLSVLTGRDLALVAREAVAPNWNAAKPERLRDRRAAPGLHVALTSGGHYYHFFANDFVPLLRALTRFGDEIGPLTIVLPDESSAFVEASLQALARAHPQVATCRLGRRERLSGVHVLWPSRGATTLEWMVVTPQEAQDLTRLFVAEYGLPTPPGTPISLFVSRGPARLRRLANEQELSSTLARRGFETFAPTAGNHPLQVDQFRRAEVVVAVHGAALTNLLFCRPGTLVVELFPTDHVKSTYAWLAHRLGLRYRAVIGSKGNLQQGFTVELDAVLQALS